MSFYNMPGNTPHHTARGKRMVGLARIHLHLIFGLEHPSPRPVSTDIQDHYTLPSSTILRRSGNASKWMLWVVNKQLLPIPTTTRDLSAGNAQIFPRRQPAYTLSDGTGVKGSQPSFEVRPTTPDTRNHSVRLISSCFIVLFFYHFIHHHWYYPASLPGCPPAECRIRSQCIEKGVFSVCKDGGSIWGSRWAG